MQTQLPQIVLSSHHSFALLHQGERHILKLGDVRAIRSRVEHLVSVERGAHTVHSLDLQLNSTREDAWIPAVERMANDQLIGLEPFRQALMESLTEEAWEALRRGNEVCGDDWTLSLTELRGSNPPATIPTHQIRRAAWLGDQFCVWREGAESDDDSPAMRVSGEGANVFLLPRLLSLLLPCRVTGEGASPTAGLGRLIRSLSLRQCRHTVRWAWIGLGTLAVLLTAQGVTPGLLGLGLFAWLVASVLILPRILGVEESLAHFERGIVWRRGSSERSLWFDAIESYAATWPSGGAAGAAADARVILRLRPHALAGLPWEIDWPLGSDQNRWAGSEALHAHLVAALGSKMQRQLLAQGEVPWTSRWSILPQGLACDAGGTEGRRLHYFSEIATWRLAQQRLEVTWTDGRAPLVLSVHEPNFFPGLLLLQLLGATPR